MNVSMEREVLPGLVFWGPFLNNLSDLPIFTCIVSKGHPSQLLMLFLRRWSNHCRCIGLKSKRNMSLDQNVGKTWRGRAHWDTEVGRYREDLLLSCHKSVGFLALCRSALSVEWPHLQHWDISLGWWWEQNLGGCYWGMHSKSLPDILDTIVLQRLQDVTGASSEVQSDC